VSKQKKSKAAALDLGEEKKKICESRGQRKTLEPLRIEKLETQANQI